MIMRHAFAENKAPHPEADSQDSLRQRRDAEVRRRGRTAPLECGRVDLAQLCRSRHDRRPVVDDFLQQGEMWQVCREFQQQGKVGQFVMEIFASFSGDAIRAVEAGLSSRLHLLHQPRGAAGQQRAVRAVAEKPGADPLVAYDVRRHSRSRAHPDAAGKGTGPCGIMRFEALKQFTKNRAARRGASSACRFSNRCPMSARRSQALQRLPISTICSKPTGRAKPLDASLSAQIQALHNQWPAYV